MAAVRPWAARAAVHIWLRPVAPHLAWVEVVTLAEVSVAGRRAAVAELRARARHGRFAVRPLVDGWSVEVVRPAYDPPDDSELESITEEQVDATDRFEEYSWASVDCYTLRDMIPARWVSGVLRVQAGASATVYWAGEDASAVPDHEPATTPEYLGAKFRVYWRPPSEHGATDSALAGCWRWRRRGVHGPAPARQNARHRAWRDARRTQGLVVAQLYIEPGRLAVATRGPGDDDVRRIDAGSLSLLFEPVATDGRPGQAAATGVPGRAVVARSFGGWSGRHTKVRRRRRRPTEIRWPSAWSGSGCRWRRLRTRPCEGNRPVRVSIRPA